MRPIMRANEFVEGEKKWSYLLLKFYFITRFYKKNHVMFLRLMAVVPKSNVKLLYTVDSDKRTAALASYELFKIFR